MTSQMFQRYGTMNVPRYTSYPTAPHFSEAVGADEYSEWLTQLSADEPVSLYLHVPYCHQICWYCGCNMKLASRPEPVMDYARSLRDEIALLAGHLPARLSVSHLHWGGGTPTALAPSDLEATMGTVRNRFDIAGDAELAIECDPRTLSNEMVGTIGRLGFTRASFGVQEFDPKVQLSINRIQPPKMVRRAVTGLRSAGVDGINFDLIYGLPHQTVETLLKTVKQCVAMAPDRIALFGYAHVPWMAKKQRMIDEAALPGPSARLAQAEAASEALRRAGYVAVGLDHFARPDDGLAEAARKGTLRRNFQGYTTDTAQALLGVGASSITRTPNGYVQNLTETGAWARSVAEGSLPVKKGLAFAGEDALRGAVIESLMCRGRADLIEAGRRYGASEKWFASAAASLADFVREGLITFDRGVVQITESGAPFVRVIASAFDEYLGTTTGRHAVAV